MKRKLGSGRLRIRKQEKYLLTIKTDAGEKYFSVIGNGPGSGSLKNMSKLRPKK